MLLLLLVPLARWDRCCWGGGGGGLGINGEESSTSILDGSPSDLRLAGAIDLEGVEEAGKPSRELVDSPPIASSSFVGGHTLPSAAAASSASVRAMTSSNRLRSSMSSFRFLSSSAVQAACDVAAAPVAEEEPVE